MIECDICGVEKSDIHLYDCYEGKINLGSMFICSECLKIQNEVGKIILRSKNEKIRRL